jgi:hypothetical protein
MAKQSKTLFLNGMLFGGCAAPRRLPGQPAENSNTNDTKLLGGDIGPILVPPRVIPSEGGPP